MSLAKRYNVMAARYAAGLCILLLAACGGGVEPNGIDDRLSSGPEHIEAAITAQQLGDYAEAILQNRRAIRLNPNNVEYRWMLSTLQLENGDPAAAELALERMVLLGMQHPDLAVRTARLQLMLDKTDALLDNRLPPLNDDNVGTIAAIHYLRGKTYSARSWSVEARKEYVKAIDFFEQARLQAKISKEALALRREMWILQSTEQDLKAAYAHANCDAADELREPLQVFTAPNGSGRTLSVGPGETYRKPSDAARDARDGDVIRIASGRYSDIAIWRANNLQIIGEGIGAGDGHSPSVEITVSGEVNTALWTVQGNNAVIDGISFSGANNNQGNAAGVKLEGSGLVVRRSQFLRNQHGLLTSGQPVAAITPTTNLVDVDPNLGSHVVVEFSEFGYSKGGNNVTIGREDRLTFRYNYSHHALGGDLLNSAARVNNIRSNRLSDEQEGSTRFLINLPAGGVSYVIGNVMYQSFRPGNQVIINYGTEEIQDSPSRLRVFHNSVLNRSVRGVLVNNAISVPAIVANNLFFGTSGALVLGAAEQRYNELAAVADIKDEQEMNFRPLPNAILIDRGVTLLRADGINMHPDAEYQHPHSAKARLKVWKPDIGAYEYCRNSE